MKEYLFTVIAAALITSVVSILSPSGERGGLSKHVGLLTALFLVCVLASPIKDTVEQLRSWADGDLPLLEGVQKEDFEGMADTAADLASKRYFGQMLTETLQAQFDLKDETVRCVVQWKETDGKATPTGVTVILSKNAIWQDPHAIAEYVKALLDCPCQVALE